MGARGVPARLSLFVSAVVLASALVLGLAPAARATTNIVPNPGFEVDCTGTPCDWTTFFSPTTVMRDTSVFHGGAASLKLGGPANGDNVVFSDCLALSPAAGNHEVSFWYDNSGPNVKAGSLSLYVYFFTAVFCTGSLTQDNIVGSNTGGWSQATAPISVPANTVSVQFGLAAMCTDAGGCSVNFDDVDFEGELLAVTLASLRATRSHGGVVVRWRTGTEVDELGFNVYRQQGNRRVRVNRRLLPAIGAVAGASYSFADRRAPRHRALRYWLEDVDLTGARTWHGPVRVAAS